MSGSLLLLTSTSGSDKLHPFSFKWEKIVVEDFVHFLRPFVFWFVSESTLGLHLLKSGSTIISDWCVGNSLIEVHCVSDPPEPVQPPEGLSRQADDRGIDVGVWERGGDDRRRGSRPDVVREESFGKSVADPNPISRFCSTLIWLRPSLVEQK